MLSEKLLNNHGWKHLHKPFTAYSCRINTFVHLFFFSVVGVFVMEQYNEC